MQPSPPSQIHPGRRHAGPLGLALALALALLADAGCRHRPPESLPPSAVRSNSPPNSFIGLEAVRGLRSARLPDSPLWTRTLPPLDTPTDWTELVASWNLRPDDAIWIRIEARGLYPDASTKFYNLGEWSAQTNRHPRQSLRGQTDPDGDVLTDTLVLKRPCSKLQIRISAIPATQGRPPRLSFLGLSFHNSRAQLSPTNAVQSLSDSFELDVPVESQLAHPGGEVWCSPTSVTMILQYWARQLHRPDLNRPVPQTAADVYDPNWPGTGNWSFNAAYAGHFQGMRAYATRLDNLDQLKAWIRHGIPVAASVCYNRLRGRSRESSGHLVVCRGWTASGQLIVNDPGRRSDNRQLIPPDRFLDAWNHSRRTVYLIFPEHHPRSSFPPPQSRSSSTTDVHPFP